MTFSSTWCLSQLTSGPFVCVVLEQLVKPEDFIRLLKRAASAATLKNEVEEKEQKNRRKKHEVNDRHVRLIQNICDYKYNVKSLLLHNLLNVYTQNNKLKF